MHPDPNRDAAAPADGHLPARQWTALILRDVLGWLPADVAALLGCTESGLDEVLREARTAVRGPGPAERAALRRLAGRAGAADLTLLGALLREHARPVAR